MTKTSHTPGPWKTRKGFRTDTTEVFHPDPECKPPFYPTELATVEGATLREQRANARLIAAAPELLQALIAITNQLERVGDTRQHKDGQYIDDARAAIAKATEKKGQPK